MDPINLNTATAAQLKNLPGVTDALAAAIIAHRPYASAAELAKVGFAPSRIASTAPHLTFPAKPSPAVNPVVIQPTPPASPSPSPSSPIDLAAIADAATDSIVLADGAQYVVNRIINLKHSISVAGGGRAKVTCTKDGTNFKSASPNLTVSGLDIKQGGVVFEAASDSFTVTGCYFGLGQPAGSVTQAFKTLPGGTNPKFDANFVVITPTVSVYIDQGGATVSGNTLCGSQNEYPLRLEVGGLDGKTIQSGALISGNKIICINGKDAVGIREFNKVRVTGNTIYGDTRWGQVPGTGQPPTAKVGQFCDECEFDHNTVYSVGNAINDDEIYQGVVVNVHDNIFVNPLAPPISADKMSVVTESNNVIQVYLGHKAWELFAVSSKGKANDLGGEKTVSIPEPKAA